MPTYHLAYDLGVDSGRLMLGTLDGGKVALDEIHTFTTGPAKVAGALHWDFDRLQNELRIGLKKAAERNLPIASLSTNTWGVDYVMYDERGLPMLPVWCYRDSRTAQGVEAVKEKVEWPVIYAETGTQFMAYNTIYQIATEPPARLARARQILLLADALNFFCSGVARNEVSLASTTQLYNPVHNRWSKRLFSALGLPENLFAPLCPGGTRLGPLKKHLAVEAGLPSIEVVASCSHEAAAATAAMPASDDAWACLCSGTWSVLALERPHPTVNDQSRNLGFSNEIGFGNSVRLLRNITGLWLLQECRRLWARRGASPDISELENLAATAPPFVSLINPDDPRFLNPEDMPAAIAEFCRETGQPVPAGMGACVRCIYESLALMYRVVLRRAERLAGKKMEQLYIVGGGSRQATLNQFTASAVKIPVLAGLPQAAALGNILVQVIALGHLESREMAGEIVRNSFEFQRFGPQDALQWDAAAARFEILLS